MLFWKLLSRGSREWQDYHGLSYLLENFLGSDKSKGKNRVCQIIYLGFYINYDCFFPLCMQLSIGILDKKINLELPTGLAHSTLKNCNTLQLCQVSFWSLDQLFKSFMYTWFSLRTLDENISCKYFWYNASQYGTFFSLVH